MLRNAKPYSRPADALRADTKTDQFKIKSERFGQFKLATNKFDQRVNDPDEETRLVPFVDINLNYRSTSEIDLKARTLHNLQPSIFDKAKIDAFIENCTFVVAFAHPTYDMKYNKVPNSNHLKIYCSNINKDLLFKNKNCQMRNSLPAAASFRVHLNNLALFNVQSAMYDKNDVTNDEHLVLSVYVSAKQTIELLPLKTCVIYLNILRYGGEWTVPAKLLSAFADLPLTPPIHAAHYA
ncbi:hypothetical protein QKQ66_gp031 [Dione juno nucleopolyhedrovirus]|uniref:Uncharacterized protein n=1 Tax=Dione juno nucleopolyhedrovirus TaxID=2594175 RepID=A0AAE6H3B3_9ABAC|nr:hypothetical protein QKQ66_gp031 [Dione juno nucleopolyhedrovirus]QDL57018.1 hypothetical protein DijuNPV-ORF-31 [Dione juno nucleopolyhedrovirus]